MKKVFRSSGSNNRRPSRRRLQYCTMISVLIERNEIIEKKMNSHFFFPNDNHDSLSSI